jgi:exo-1,4-beta-D-glucosaminidase
LALETTDGKLVSSNFYWLSTKDDTLDWAKSTWYYTPASSFADLTALQNLKPVELRTVGRVERNGEEEVAHVTVENPSSSLAFAVHLQLKRGRDGEEVLPVLWEDNYFALLPGEKRELTALYKTKSLEGKSPSLTVEAWNVGRKTQTLAPTRR